MAEREGIETMEQAIGVVMALAMLIPLSIVVGIIWSKHAAMVMLHKQRMAALEKGLQPPRASDFMPTGERSDVLRDSMRRGLLWLFGGIGLFLAVRFTGTPVILHQDSPTLFAAAIVSACIGIAYLTFYVIEIRRHE
jgi:lysozyme family protein